MNQVTIIGNLGQDPELRYTQSQQAVATLSIATNEPYTDKDGNKKDHVEWHRVVVWGKTAENCSKYLAKGRKAAVTGKLRTRSWENKEGVKMYTTEIHATGVEFLDSAKDGGNRAPHPAENGSAGQAPASTDMYADEIPF